MRLKLILVGLHCPMKYYFPTLAHWPLYEHKKSRIRETPTLSTDAASRTNTNLKRLRDLPSRKNLVKKIWGESIFFFGGGQPQSLHFFKLIFDKFLTGISAFCTVLQDMEHFLAEK